MTRIRSAINFPDQFLRHQNNEAELNTFDPNAADDFRFEVLEEPNNIVRFRAVGPNSKKFLRHKNFRLLLEAPPSDKNALAQFIKDSTFFVESPKGGSALENNHSFRAIVRPSEGTRFIRHIDFHVFIDEVNDEQAKKDATWVLDSNLG
jgi:hypothetical protein